MNRVTPEVEPLQLLHENIISPLEFIFNHSTRMSPKLLLSLLILLICTGTAMAQQTDTLATEAQAEDSETISLFLDCRRCDGTYIRNEVTFVNFVRNQDVADLHLLVTRQWTGNGGSEFTLRFMGKREFEGRNDTLIYFSPQSDTDDEQRVGLVNYVKIGLLPYVRSEQILNNLNITYTELKGSDSQDTSLEDPWNNWVFDLNARTSISGEESRKNFSLSGSVEASRVTENWKTRLSYNQDYDNRQFTNDGVTNTFITESSRLDGLLVKSLGQHWSAGVRGNLFSSTRNNIDLSYAGSPALEYSVFPYAEYAEREITFLYSMMAGYYDYSETTIFNRDSQILVQQRLESRMEFTQPWGEISGRLNASTYMHDLNKNRFDVNMRVDFRIFRGLSVNLSGRYSWINDQLSIPAGDINDAEQLLNLRQQLTSYSYGASFGISYTFGSIFNNVVNPRF